MKKVKISRWRFQGGGVEQGFHNHGKKNQRLNYDLEELDVVEGGGKNFKQGASCYLMGLFVL